MVMMNVLLSFSLPPDAVCKRDPEPLEKEVSVRDHSQPHLFNRMDFEAVPLIDD
jgi:hypothetical protein